MLQTLKHRLDKPFRGLEQMTLNHWVEGSIPSGITDKSLWKFRGIFIFYSFQLANQLANSATWLNLKPMATFKVLLDTRRQLQDGTYPLVVRIYNGRNYKTINPKIYLKENQFDASNKRRSFTFSKNSFHRHALGYTTKQELPVKQKATTNCP